MSSPPAGRAATGGAGGLGRSTAVMAAGTAASRVLGVVRGAVLAGAIGVTSASGNAFGVANWLPNVIYMLIAGGVLNAVLVPQVVRAYRTSRGQEFVDRLLTVAALGLVGVTVVLTVAAPLIIRIAASGEDPHFIALATTFAFWCIPQVFFYGMYTLLGQVLNARGNFGPYMWAPVVNNVVAVAGLAVFIGMFGGFSPGGPNDSFAVWDAQRVAILAGSATLGVVCQALILVVPLYRGGFRYRPRTGWRGVGLGSAGRVAGWTFAALLIGQVGILVVTRITTGAAQASDYAPGVAGNAAYTYAFTIFMLPHSLVTVSLLTALFTRLSAHVVDRDLRGVRADASYGLRTVGVFTVFATAVLMVLAVPVVRLVMPTESPQSVGAVAGVVVALMVGLVPFGAWSLVQRIFYAYEDAKGLFRIQAPMAAVVAGGALLSAWLLPVRWWAVGAASAISASYLLGVFWGGRAVLARLGHLGGGVVRLHVRTTAAALVASTVGWAVSRLFGDLSALGFFRALVVCVVVGTVMLAIYLGLLRAMHISELDDLLAPVLVRLEPVLARLSPVLDRAAPVLSRLGLGGRAGGTDRPGRGRGRSMGTPAGPDMQGGGMSDVVVGRGTLLAGRYRLRQPVDTDLPGVECWTAQDQILDRPVRALVLREGAVTQAQDAARRAALVTDPRLLRVLDVGAHEGLPYVVTEPVTGRDLTELTQHGPLPADQARSIIGEAAVALEVARRRGVHHLALRPSAVHVTPEGAVLVSGLAMDGELLGHGLGDARSTTRADTVGLVSLLYLTLTGRWPVPPGSEAGRTPSAPLVGGVPMAPAELSPAVPNDLDTLCAVTLGPHDDGPHSPAELVRELEPWGPIAAQEIFGAIDAAAAWKRPTGSDGDGGAASPGAEASSQPDAPTPTDADSAAHTVQRQSVRSALAGQPGPAVRPGTPPPAVPPPAIPPAVAPAARPDDRSGGGVGPVSPVSAANQPARTVALPVVPGEAAAVPPSGVPPTITPPRGPASRPAGGRPDPTPRSAHPAGPARPSASGREHEHESFDVLIGRSAEVLTRRRFDPTPVVLALVAIAVVVGLVLAWRAFTSPAPPIGGGDGFGDVSDSATQDPGADGAQGDAEAEPDAGQAEEPPPAPEPPVIASAQQIDPPPGGDENEHPEAVPAAIDGDPATYWYSRTYKSPTYGMKPGIGYGITLAAPATVTTVTLNVNGTGGMVEVRATDPSTPTEGEVLASGPLGPETVLTLSAPTETQHIVLWFTALPQTVDGSNRIELTEVRLS